MAERRRVLFLTEADLGQSNIFLAVCDTLGRMGANIDIHLASTSALEAPFRQIIEDVRAATAAPNSTLPPPSMTFHKIPGTAFSEQLASKPEMVRRVFNLKKAGPIETPRTIKFLVHDVLATWSGPELVAFHGALKEIITAVDPHLAVCDPLFCRGMTAVVAANRKCIVLSPNSLLEHSMADQPYGGALWRYPCVASGYQYPIPWYLIPANVFYFFVLIGLLIFNPKGSRLSKYFEEQTGDKFITVMEGHSLGNKAVVAGHPALDYPTMVISPSVTATGPIIRQNPSILARDTQLLAWLARGPTVYIALGSHSVMTEEKALAMATAIKRLLDRGAKAGGDFARLQVLWKLIKKKYGHGEDYSTGAGSAFDRILGEEVASGRILLTTWIEPQPYDILRTGHIVAQINHCGANSFNECASAGVPMVGMPAWLDCWDYANRIEMLGIGKCGNRNGAAVWDADEISHALEAVVLGPDADNIRARSKKLAEVVNRECGREVAATAILNELESA